MTTYLMLVYGIPIYHSSSDCTITDDLLTSKTKNVQCGDFDVESGVMSPDVQIHVIGEASEFDNGKVGHFEYKGPSRIFFYEITFHNFLTTSSVLALSRL